MARTDTLGNFLTDVAEAIRTKEGTTETIPANEFDTRITNLSVGGKYAPRMIMFRDYSGTELDYELENLDTSNLTDMSDMLRGCKKITSYNISHFNVSNVKYFNSLFYNNSALTSLDLSGWENSICINTTTMFYGCSALQYLDIRGLDFTNVTQYSGMFDSVPGDCEIIVKDDAQRDWILLRAGFTNIKTVAEL